MTSKYAPQTQLRLPLAQLVGAQWHPVLAPHGHVDIRRAHSSVVGGLTLERFEGICGPGIGLRVLVGHLFLARRRVCDETAGRFKSGLRDVEWVGLGSGSARETELI